MTRYLLLKHYAEIEGVPPLFTWPKADFDAHVQYMNDVSRQLQDSGEWVTELALIDEAAVVRSDGGGQPSVTSGPFAPSGQMLAGYMEIDVASEQRAFEIAALLSAAPGPGGKPIAERIEVRRVMDGNPAVE